MHESSFPSESSCNGNDGIHLFVNPNNGFPLTTDRSQSSHLPDSILRLRIVISLRNFANLLWTRDGNYFQQHNLNQTIKNILHLWKFEVRRCICVVHVSDTCNLHAFDFGIRNLIDSSFTHVFVGHGSIELLCRTTIDASITHIRCVPYDSTRFISIGSDNIRFWRINNENDLKSMSISIDRISRFAI
ncbi:unnamed protein product [Rotaria magnacalcarata]|uniref:Uncharacterized protein n=2 Tax=Rotaria magnacalcarata TaxID=392030 RepID=A0A814Q9H2_9BILA|nr:unnamed protein product [Rotaria magnacalcarata]CAF1323952.1 unnamed protein product [Rotaria magnacalcarata]CAF4298409.1 unnamed protein product [Rotaria magnacalcarata]